MHRAHCNINTEVYYFTYAICYFVRRVRVSVVADVSKKLLEAIFKFV
jgi:hypothetical protein